MIKIHDIYRPANGRGDSVVVVTLRKSHNEIGFVPASATLNDNGDGEYGPNTGTRGPDVKYLSEPEFLEQYRV